MFSLHDFMDSADFYHRLPQADGALDETPAPQPPPAQPPPADPIPSPIRATQIRKTPPLPSD